MNDEWSKLSELHNDWEYADCACMPDAPLTEKWQVEYIFQHCLSCGDYDYPDQQLSDNDKRKMFVCDEIFGLITYDGYIDLEFGSYLTESVKAIKYRNTFDYIRLSDQHYKNFIIAANLMCNEFALGWGGSIRGAWIDNCKERSNGRFTDAVIEWICDIETEHDEILTQEYNYEESINNYLKACEKQMEDIIESEIPQDIKDKVGNVKVKEMCKNIREDIEKRLDDIVFKGIMGDL